MNDHRDNEWKCIDYLINGTSTQKLAYEILKSTKILEHLAPYQPILIGTIPIDIDILGSDIDIACEVYDPGQFKIDLISLFPDIEIIQRNSVVIGRTKIKNVDIEFYGENSPVTEQSGYIHMLVEARLLKLGNETFRKTIRDLKKSGLKTEPAFAKVLSISGNPYQKLLELYQWNEQELLQFFQLRELCKST